MIDNKFIFGYNNIKIKDTYRMLSTEDFNTELISIDIIDYSTTEYITNYSRVLEIDSNVSDLYLLTDTRILRRSDMSSPDTVVAHVTENSHFSVNDDYLVYYVPENNVIEIINLSTNINTNIPTNGLFYIQIDKNNNVFVFSNFDGSFTYNIDTNTTTPINNSSILDSIYYDNFISIEGPQKGIKDGDDIYSIYLKSINTLDSVGVGVNNYVIEKNLYGLVVYVDGIKTDFTYNPVTGYIVIQHLFSGYETVNYIYITNPYYGGDSADYVFKYKSDTNTALPKGKDKYGNDVYDHNDLDDAVVPTEVNKVGNLIII
jgi:hypothetical protein